jgi:hypothetical protein
MAVKVMKCKTTGRTEMLLMHARDAPAELFLTALTDAFSSKSGDPVVIAVTTDEKTVSYCFEPGKLTDLGNID